MEKGYMGKMLIVDLSKEEIRSETLYGKEILRKFVGCVGLGMKILCDEVVPQTHWDDPQNPLIIMTGPLTGTPVPCGSNWTVVTINRDVPYAPGTSHSHGFFGAFLRFAGFDGVIVRGKAKRPVYLRIYEGKAELSDASHIWGKDTHETEDLIRKEIGDREASIAAIGPAGENLCMGACIENDRNHTAAKGGVGAVMGSKKLKAIAVYGRKTGVSIANSKRLLETCVEWRKALFEGTGNVAWLLKNGGITRHYGALADISILAGKNLTTAEFGVEYGKNYVEAAKKSKVKPKACFSCPIACAYDLEIRGGPYDGKVATLGGGGENTEGAAAMIGVLDANTAFMLTDYYDRLGFDSGVGATISFAYECFERGILTKKDVDGLELRWGNAEAAYKLLDKIVKREGIGKVLAEGPRKAAEIIGKGSAQFAVHIKGAGFNLHDWRAAWSRLLGQAVAGAGPVWQGTGVDAFMPEPDLGYPEIQDPLVKEGKAEAVKITQIKKLWDDCLGICWFSSQSVPNITRYLVESLKAVTGWDDFTKEEGFLLGERIVNMQRLFSIRRGFKSRDDLDISPRLLEAPPDGKAKGKSIKPHIKGMIREYYKLMGWDVKTGFPLEGTLERLGLKDYVGFLRR